MSPEVLEKQCAGKREYIWLNGELIDWQEAKVHVLTHSLHYSGSVYEGEKSYNSKIFKLEEHTDRLLASARSMYLDVAFSKDEIIEAHKLLIKENNITDGYIRPLIFRGAESLNLTNPKLSINLLIAAIPTIQTPPKSLNLQLSRWIKPHPNAMPPQVKASGHYNMLIVAQIEAKQNRFDDALLLDWRGFVAECTTSNIFFVKGDQLITPIADAFLNGITRQTIIAIAREHGLSVEEQYIEPQNIKDYNECFVTGTAAEVKEVTSITLLEEKIIFNDNKITNLLKQEYNKLVRKN